MKNGYATARHLRFAISWLLLVICAVPVSAQIQARPPESHLPIREIIDRFERDTQTGALRNVGASLVNEAIRNRASPGRRDSLLSALERLALTHESLDVRHRATAYLATAGKHDTPFAAAGVVPRLVRIYQANDAGVVRFAIRDVMPQQVEQRAAAAFLRSIAAEHDPHWRHRVDDMGDHRLEALFGLARMGEEGRAALQAMHRSGEARSPQARQALEHMAQRGFPVRDLVRERQARP